MTERQRVFLGFIIAPMVAPVILFAVALIIDYDAETSIIELVRIFLDSLGMTVSASYVVALAIGVPIYFLLRWLHRLSAINLVLIASILGAVFFLFFWAQIPYGLGSISSMPFNEVRNVVTIGAILGGGIACCFSVIAGITMRSSRRSKLRGLA